MKMIRVAVVIALVVVSMETNLWCQEKAAEAPINVVKYNAEAWAEYKSLDGRYSVTFPAKPVEETSLIDTVLGKASFHTSLVVVEHKEAVVVCLAAYNDFPFPQIDEVMTRKVLDSIREGAVSKPHRKLIEDREISLQSYPGREVIFEDDNVLIDQRVFLVKSRMYQIVVTISKESNADLTKVQKDIRQRVFESYKIVEQ